MSSSAGTALQNKFVLIHIVELSPTEWCLNHGNRSRQNKLCHFLRDCIFSACAKRMPLNSCHGAHGRLWVINQILLNSKRVLLSVSLCVEMKCTKDRACRKQGT